MRYKFYPVYKKKICFSHKDLCNLGQSEGIMDFVNIFHKGSI